jgi:hypothetical protein
MILILNYLPTLISLLGAYVFYRTYTSKVAYTPEQRIKRLVGIVAAIVGSIVLLQALTPHYMPKHNIPRSSVPPIESVGGEIRNLQPQPVPGEERDRMRKEAYEERIEFVKQNQ